MNKMSTKNVETLVEALACIEEFRTWMASTAGISAGTATRYAKHVQRLLEAGTSPRAPEPDLSLYAASTSGFYLTSWGHWMRFTGFSESDHALAVAEAVEAVLRDLSPGLKPVAVNALVSMHGSAIAMLDDHPPREAVHRVAVARKRIDLKSVHLEMWPHLRRAHHYSDVLDPLPPLALEVVHDVKVDLAIGRAAFELRDAVTPREALALSWADVRYVEKTGTTHVVKDIALAPISAWRLAARHGDVAEALFFGDINGHQYPFFVGADGFVLPLADYVEHVKEVGDGLQRGQQLYTNSLPRHIEKRRSAATAATFDLGGFDDDDEDEE